MLELARQQKISARDSEQKSTARDDGSIYKEEVRDRCELSPQKTNDGYNTGDFIRLTHASLDRPAEPSRTYAAELVAHSIESSSAMSAN